MVEDHLRSGVLGDPSSSYMGVKPAKHKAGPIAMAIVAEEPIGAVVMLTMMLAFPLASVEKPPTYAVVVE